MSSIFQTSNKIYIIYSQLSNIFIHKVDSEVTTPKEMNNLFYGSRTFEERKVAKTSIEHHVSKQKI